jgi:hypothetical protein
MENVERHDEDQYMRSHGCGCQLEVQQWINNTGAGFY